MKPFKLRLFILFCLCLGSLSAQAEQQMLTIATWGGSYESAQQKALFGPFEVATGIQINTQYYRGELAILKGDLIPDIIDMTMDDALLACEQNLVQRLKLSKILAPSPDGLEAEKDFIAGALLPCGVAHLSYSTLIAYDDRAFTGEKPQRIADFFDIKRFPGMRALRKQPSAILEWALMTEGVPIDQIYDLLSTDRGMRLALRRLDSIRDHIVWWDDPKQPAALLKSGQVVMSSGFNGRFFDAQTQGDNITMIWDGQIIDWDVWVVPLKPDQTNIATNKFLRYVTQSENMAHLAEHIPYGPSRLSALKRIGLHPQNRIPMRDHLPTAPHHLDRALFRDAKWYARTLTLRKNRFWGWINSLQDGEN
ncbi:MAG: extracellular solute-binding protein [Gammaproteobacteria bacterium]|nr:extracellular solute-binding protein [Gammaproteobacteria bacterium]